MNVRSINFKLILPLLFLISTGSLFAGKFPDSSGAKSVKKLSAEPCLPATGHTDLDINNVRARINTGGDMWWDLVNSAQYEIPKGSRKTSAFCSAIWMAGIDVNGQLKCAAQRYRGNGNDFWPGPLTVDGIASIDAGTCQEYDKHFVITLAEVNEFIAWYNDPSGFPAYKIPTSILKWPAHGDISKKQSYYLAQMAGAW